MTRKRRLSEEDRALWERVARTATPLEPARKNATVEKPPASERPVSNPVAPREIPAFRVGERVRHDHSKGHDLAHTLEQRLSAQPVRMDRKLFKRMKKGRLVPERKIDLHGMSLAQAHPALTRFIFAAHADACRLVLVVTGKGKWRQDDGPIPTPRGVLRNQVPIWLSQAPLGPLVLQVTDAHQSHGGSGAYYVYLSRRRQM